MSSWPGAARPAWRALALAGVLAVGGSGCTWLRPVPPSQSPPSPATGEPPVRVVRAPVDRPQRPSPVLQSAFPFQVAIGLCEDYPEESRSIESARRDLNHARLAGAKVLRIAFGWDAIEAQRGVYDWSFWDEFVPLAVETYGIRLIPYVCYTPDWAAARSGDDAWRSPPEDVADFERFMQTISSRYNRWIDSWEIWNEPDNAAYWTGSAAEFADLTHAGSRGVRLGDPDAKVVLGGFAWDLDYLRELLEVYDVAPAIDIVNVHSYFETWSEDPIEVLPRYLEEAAQIVHTYGEGEPIWMAETGYSSRGALRPGVTELYRSRYRNEHTVEYQAGALARTFLASLASGRLSLFAWYRINDLAPAQDVIGDDHNRHLGLIDVNGQPKPAFETLRWLSELFREPFRIADREFVATVEDNARIEARQFAFANGRRLLAVWLLPDERAPTSEPIEDIRQVEATVTIPHARLRLVENVAAPSVERAAEVRVAPTADDRGTTFQVPLVGGQVALLLVE